MFFNSRRSSVLSKRGMVATSQHLAAVAGLKKLMKGGNAIDGAVAAAAALAAVCFAEAISTVDPAKAIGTLRRAMGNGALTAFEDAVKSPHLLRATAAAMLVRR